MRAAHNAARRYARSVSPLSVRKEWESLRHERRRMRHVLRTRLDGRNCLRDKACGHRRAIAPEGGMDRAWCHDGTPHASEEEGTAGRRLMPAGGVVGPNARCGGVRQRQEAAEVTAECAIRMVSGLLSHVSVIGRAMFSVAAAARQRNLRRGRIAYPSSPRSASAPCENQLTRCCWRRWARTEMA